MVDTSVIDPQGLQIAAEQANANGAQQLAANNGINIAAGQYQTDETRGGRGSQPSVIVDLSEEAQAFLEAQGEEDGTQSPAQLAQDFLEQEVDEQGGPFGQTVSAFALVTEEDPDLAVDGGEEGDDPDLQVEREEGLRAADIARPSDEAEEPAPAEDNNANDSEETGFGPAQTPAADNSERSDLFSELENLRRNGGAQAIA